MHLLIGIVSVLAIGVTGFKADPNPAGRSRRSDDGNPLQAVVDHLTQQMGQMQAQVQANKNSLDNLQQAVGFTVRTRNEDMHGFAVGQVVKFDNPVFNAGNGYNPASGIFTAPVSGTYVFFLQTLHHNNDDTKVFLDIMKNDRFLTRAHAGFTAFENGSTLAVTHLNQGDTIEVQVG
nr:hypothetical protein BaRGS_003321 [Batillaria attramentaria]